MFLCVTDFPWVFFKVSRHAFLFPCYHLIGKCLECALCPECCWQGGGLLSVPETSLCISKTDLLRQVCVLSDWHRSCRSNGLPRPVIVYWDRANQFQCWPFIGRQGSHWSKQFLIHRYGSTQKASLAQRIFQDYERYNTSQDSINLVSIAVLRLPSANEMVDVWEDVQCLWWLLTLTPIKGCRTPNVFLHGWLESLGKWLFNLFFYREQAWGVLKTRVILLLHRLINRTT